jgi:hypothetical protein
MAWEVDAPGLGDYALPTARPSPGRCQRGWPCATAGSSGRSTSRTGTNSTAATPVPLSPPRSFGGIVAVFSVVKRVGASLRRLDSQRRRRIEELARDRGITCPGCGSARLSSSDNAHRHVGVWPWCKNEDTHPGCSGRKQYFKFSLEEARGIGIQGRREEPVQLTAQNACTSPKFPRKVSKTTHLGNRTGEPPRLGRTR